ncbi:SRPBCC family protein [Lactobacillus sp. ESL0731]|uniref:SRPBCC family protein n=1 Tax=unclassified Lactobacillus TaxID=2620435 RepID=UPI0023F6834C|nr:MULTISPECIES: SRPBCC family protein [unclassified Lactobacillus]WEV50873.1 SRPBCC family protein [Lactobacillus sp. ESL0700]WEV62004.1 SRPBCC family protein [Lactobacillus sp. ESL0731]
MEQKIFTNVRLVNQTQEQVQRFLLQPQSLLKWVPEIRITEQSSDQFVIERTTEAPNKREQIKIISDNDQVTYVSTQGKIAYRVEFQLSKQSGKTLIEESLYLADQVAGKLPLKLLKPIAKHAFNLNLNNLAQVLEAQS